MRFALLAFSLVVSFVLIEVGLTIFYAGSLAPGPYQVASHWNSPYVFLAKPGHGVNTYSIRRTLPMSEDPAADGLRILSYGDSIAAGYQLTEQESYAAILENQLREIRGDSVEVLNMVRGHSPTIYSFHLRTDVPRFKPDGVIVQIELLNDVSDEALTATVGRDSYGLPMGITRHRYIVGWDGHLLAPISLAGTFVERTKLFAKVSRWVGRIQDRLDPNPIFESDSNEFFYSSTADRFRLRRDALEAGFDRIFESIAAIHRYLDERGIQLVVLIVPSREAFGGGPYADAAQEILDRSSARADALEIPYLLPFDAISNRGGSQLFMDFCHPTAFGNSVIAEVLETRVRAW